MTSPSKTETTTLSAWALAYAEQGWPVLPLVAAGKTPLTENGLKDASTDSHTILRWWDRWPHANVGLRTGIAFDVLDIDGTEGLDNLLAFIDEKYYHQGPLSFTGRGYHLLFQITGLKNGANLIPKVDFRGDGGYIVAPPSLHPSGTRYHWDVKRNFDSQLVPAPAWLRRLHAREASTFNKTTTAWDPTKSAIENASALGKFTIRELRELPRDVLDQLPANLRYKVNRPDIIEACRVKGITLRPKGHLLVARCPLGKHNDSTPSFTIYTDNDTFYCFGCHAYGDSNDILNL